MLWTIAAVMLALWMWGVAYGHTMGGVIHTLLVFAVAVVVIRMIQGRRVV